ncbi:MAG: DUF6272 family protein [Bacteroidia bacterium]
MSGYPPDNIVKLPLLVFIKGNFKDLETHVIIDMVETNEKNTESKSQLRKLMFLSVEAIQNIQRYSYHHFKHLDSTLIMNDGNYYYIITTNVIPTAKIEELESRMLKIKDKDKEELNELYISKITSEEKTEKGAGLGLIEMARKSEQINYSFDRLDDDYSEFTLSLAIPTKKKSEEISDVKKALEINKQLTNNFIRHEDSFCFIGDFSNKFIITLLEFLISKSKRFLLNKKTTIHYVLIELIQNIKRHSYSPHGTNGKGYISLEWSDKELVLNIFNYAENANAGKLKEKILSLGLTSMEQLQKMSLEILSDLDATNGLGLVDISKVIYPSRIECKVDAYKDDVSKVLLTLKLV